MTEPVQQPEAPKTTARPKRFWLWIVLAFICGFLSAILFLTFGLALAVPSVSGFIEDAQVGQAEATVTNIETALTGMLADTGRKNFAEVFAEYPHVEPGDSLDTYEMQRLIDLHSQAIYILLHKGRNAELPEGFIPNDGVLRKLSTLYMPDLQTDPWGNQYRFYIGPWPNDVPIHFRSYKLDGHVEGLKNPAQFAKGQTIPDTDAKGDGGYGIPAPPDKFIYIWSRGKNLQSDQGYFTQTEMPVPTEYTGGGDDINNWDKTKGWTLFY